MFFLIKKIFHQAKKILESVKIQISRKMCGIFGKISKTLKKIFSKHAHFQVNCYCPNLWKQLVLDHRKYGECFFPTKIDASWTATKYECPILSQNHTGNGHLVYVNSDLKNAFINEFYMKNWDDGNLEKPNYDIGFYYDKTTQKYIWINGVTNNPYSNWADGQPNLATGECVAAFREEGNVFKWQSINCVTEHGR